MPSVPAAIRVSRGRWLGLAGLVFLAACSNEPTELAIPRDDLPNVLLAVYLAESKAEIIGESLPQARIDALRSFGYDTTVFNRTMDGLANDPEFAKDVYESLIDSVVFAQRSIRGGMMADSNRAIEQ